MQLKRIALFIILITGLACVAQGQETTGNIEGTVTDQNGANVPNVTITLESQSFRRTATTNEEGFFRALQLQPGIYTVRAQAATFQPFLRENVQVVLGRTTPVNIQLLVSGVGAQVTVTSANELPIDPTSSRIQTNLTQSELDQLPKGTNFTSALKAVPSVRPEPSAAGFSIDGATGVENSFIIDGQEVANFRTGTLNSNNNLPFQLVREIQVKNSGFEAEFGGATGGVINVVTKSGSNQLRGDVGIEFNTSRLSARPRQIIGASSSQLSYLFPKRDEGTDVFPFASLGGPIIKNRLWFFASATPQYYHTQRTFTFPNGTVGEFRRRDQFDYYFARLDAAITNNFSVYSTFTYNPIKINGLLPSFTSLNAASTVGGSSAVSPDAQSQLGGRQPASNFNINATYTPTSYLVVTGRFSRGYLNEKLNSYGIPDVTRRACFTEAAGFNCSAGFQNVSTNSLTNYDISIRKNYEFDASLIVDHFFGRHQFKAGYQRFNISNRVDSGYFNRGYILFYPGETFETDGGVIFGNRPGEVGIARLVRIGTFGEASSNNQAIYVQDSYQPLSNLTFNVGVRFERESVPSFTEGFPGIEFNFGDKIAPRLGVAWDVLGNGKFKIFANYGQFFDRFKYELPRGSFGGELFYNYYFPLLASMPNPSDYTLQYGIDNSLTFIDSRVPSNDPEDYRVDPDLKPVRQTEFTLGTQYDLGLNTIFGARYTHKQIDETIEDVGFHIGTSEAYFIANPGRGICQSGACGQYSVGAPTPKPQRDYDALELTIDKRFSSFFTINANYTLSRLYGNYSGLASTDEFLVNQTARDSPNVNRFFDTPFDGYVVGGDQNNGLLPTDRTHVFKFFGAYTVNGNEKAFRFFRLPSNNELELSTFFTAQSGTPLTTRVDLVNNEYIPLFGRGDLGRTETYTQTDAAMAYRYRFGRDNRYAIQFNVDVLNLFNENNVLGRYESISVTNFTPALFGISSGSYEEFDRAFFDGRVNRPRILDLINNQVQLGTDPDTGEPIFDAVTQDARYNQPFVFQAPRTVRFGFRLTF